MLPAVFGPVRMNARVLVMTDESPRGEVPANLSTMTPEQAWNAAITQAQQIADWESFWNDGQGTSSKLDDLLVSEPRDSQEPK